MLRFQHLTCQRRSHGKPQPPSAQKAVESSGCRKSCKINAKKGDLWQVGGGVGGVEFWEGNAPGGRGAAVNTQQAQNWAAGWHLRAKTCHGQDDAHMSWPGMSCPAVADGYFTIPERPPDPNCPSPSWQDLGVPWEKLWHRQELGFPTVHTKQTGLCPTSIHQQFADGNFSPLEG